MKLPSKIVLLSLTGIAAVGVLLWMRSPASWRPQKIGMLPKTYAPQHISSNGRLVVAVDMLSTVSYAFKTFDLTNGKTYDWPDTNNVGDMAVPAFGWAEPFYWFLKASESGQPQSIEFQDPINRQTKHSLPWKNRDYSSFMAVRVSGGRALVLSPQFFREFDLKRGKVVREVKLEDSFPPGNDDETPSYYAISADEKSLYGCQLGRGRVWEAHTGKLLNQWILPAPKNTPPPEPNFFSPDGNIVIYRRNMLWSFVESATGKTRWTKNISVSLASCFSTEVNEVIVPQKDNCEVREVATGRILRHLPGPTLSFPNIVRVNSDWIYTTNVSGQILRWRAR